MGINVMRNCQVFAQQLSLAHLQLLLKRLVLLEAFAFEQQDSLWNQLSKSKGYGLYQI